MKKFTKNDSGMRGSLPPQLFKYINMADIGPATREFSEFINNIARDFHSKLDENMKWANIAKIKLSASKIFGQPVSIDYVASGTQGSVYKVKIGDETFALKINRLERFFTDELESMHLQKKARNLVNKHYIGSSFDFGGETYSWFLMDFIENENADKYDLAIEKMYYAKLTKGVEYSDKSIMNVKDGKIIDLGGLSIRKINLTRIETDMVKKLVYIMKSGDVDKFAKLVDIASRRNPAVIKYLFINMMLLKFETPPRFEKFRDIIAAYNTMLKSNERVTDTSRDR